MHKINKTAVAFLRRYATLFIKKDAVPLQSPAAELPLTWDDLEWPPLALWPSSAEKLF